MEGGPLLVSAGGLREVGAVAGLPDGILAAEVEGPPSPQAPPLPEHKPSRVGLHGGRSLAALSPAGRPRREDTVETPNVGPTLLTSRLAYTEHGGALEPPPPLGCYEQSRRPSGFTDSPASSTGTDVSVGSAKVPSRDSLPIFVSSRRSIQLEVDAIVKEVARHYGVQICAVAFQKAGRTAFVSKQGIDLESIPLKGEDDSPSKQNFDFFRHCVARPLPIIIGDASKDVRLHADPLVTGPHRIRFYASAPVNFEDGFSNCTLSIADSAPRRDFLLHDTEVLVDAASKVGHLLMLLRSRLC